MITIDPKETSTPILHAYLQGTVSPRPIALASTIDGRGRVNLSPFSFFNMVSSRPPTLVFSPARRVRNNTTKHTYENILEVPEVVINIVRYSMVEQVSLASVEFDKDVNEFEKSGLTPIASIRVKPPRVAESPASFECIVRQVIPLGDQGGAGNLILCEIVLAHFKEEIFDDQGRIDPQKVDAVARMGGDYYCRAHGENVFVVPKPTDRPAIGFDQIPPSIRDSRILTGNDLGRLGNVENLPSKESIGLIQKDSEFQNALKGGEDEVHRLAQRMMKQGLTEEAWKVLLAYRSTAKPS